MTLTPQAVLDFWFSLKSPGKKDDARVQEALRPAYDHAAAGELDIWADDPRERMALTLLLDQIPRHLFRDDPRTYATDAKAQELTARFIEHGDWAGFAPLERFYCAMPWLHAEDLPRQLAINPIYHQVAPQIAGLEFMSRIADLYLETIRRFGRFPHRNSILGRDTTPEEATFVKEEWGPRRRRVIEGEA